METEPQKVCIRRPVRKTTLLHHEQPGHQSQPDQDQRYQVHKATQVQKGPNEAHRVHGHLGQVH